MMGALYNNTYQFVQTDDYVMILVEMVHDARIIPIFDSRWKKHVPIVFLPSTNPGLEILWVGMKRMS